MNKNILVLYHANCLDGFGAAYAAWRKFKDEAEYIPCQYGDEPPDCSGKQVYILDFSFPRETLIEMNAQANFLLVLDHHKTAKSDLEGLPFAVFDMEKSGCILAWEHFHPAPDSAPEMLNLIQDRDLWKFEYPETKDFCAGLWVKDRDFEEWYYCNYDEITAIGKVLNCQFQKEVENLAKRAHTISVVDRETGQKRFGLAVNAPAKYSSELGNVLANSSGVCGITYAYDGSKQEWQYSARSIDSGVDVSAIAKDYGGGGHRNAAGFSSNELLFLQPL